MDLITKKQDKQLGYAMATIFAILMILFLLLAGFKIHTPPMERDGMVINFGMQATGSGEIQPENITSPTESKEVAEEQPTETSSTEEEVEAPNDTPPAEEAPTEETPTETTDVEEVLTADNSEDKVKTTEDPVKKAEEEARLKEIEEERIRKAAEDAKREKEEAEKARLKKLEEERLAKEAEIKRQLEELTNPYTSSEDAGSQGDDDVAGDKGRMDGGIDPGDYFMDPGYASGEGSFLSKRQAQTEPEKDYNCPGEVGQVKVQITVNRSGQVIRASIYTNGTDTGDQCLRNRALQLAKEYKFNPDPKAPAEQIGYVLFNFREH